MWFTAPGGAGGRRDLELRRAGQVAVVLKDAATLRTVAMQLLAEQPESYAGQWFLGNALAHEGKKLDALAAYTRALRGLPRAGVGEVSGRHGYIDPSLRMVEKIRALRGSE